MLGYINNNNNTLDLCSAFLDTQRHFTKNNKMKKTTQKFNNPNEGEQCREGEREQSLMLIGSFEEVCFEGFLEGGE